MELALAQVVGLRPVYQIGQLQLKTGDPVAQINQAEAAVLGQLFPNGLEAQSLIIKLQAAFQIQDVEIDMDDCKHGFRLPF